MAGGMSGRGDQTDFVAYPVIAFDKLDHAIGFMGLRDFANAYPVDAAETAYYLVRPGMNRAGRDLCKTSEGTGANASVHDPKSRFGDSAPGRGSCFSYICPNDAIPPRNL